MLDLLRQITESMNEAESVQAALDGLVWQICDAIHADACAIYVHEDKTDSVKLVAVRYLEGLNQAKYHDVEVVHHLLDQVVEQRRALSLLNTPELDIDPGTKKKQAVQNQFNTFLAVPIIFQNQVYGVLLAERLAEEPFSDNDEAFLVTLSAQVATTVAHALKSGGLKDKLQGVDKGTSALILSGQSGMAGVAVGEAMVVFPPADFSSISDQPSENIEADLEAFTTAIDHVEKDIHAMEERMQSHLGQAEQALFMAYTKMLQSDRFCGAVVQRIKDGEWVQSALKAVVKENVATFEAMEDEYLSERADDVRDLGRRVLAYLQQEAKKKRKTYPMETILVGPDITASMLAEVPPGRLKAVISGTGSRNSHVAILANALGVPSVMGVDPLPCKNLPEAHMVVDGYTGRIFVRPNKTLHDAYVHLEKEEKELQLQLKELAELPAETSDAQSIALMGNISLISDTNPARAACADGVGLYRSEVPFMMRERFPSEEEQRVIYRQILQAFDGCPVTMRTLDAGGDKALPYFCVEEDNPYLGWRGMRMMLDHPDIFLTQVRAMMRASEGLYNLRIMLPMVASWAEIESAKTLIHQAYDSLQAEGVVIRMPMIGAMIEIPSALYQMDQILDQVDFISVGSNDLIQYLLAVDRGNPRVASYYDAYHPAVMHALAFIAQVSHGRGKAVSICGELAGDPLATMILVGMGYVGLSMAASSILKVKWVLRSFSMQDCQKALEDILGLSNSHDIKAYLSEKLIDAGLGGLIRAGKF